MKELVDELITLNCFANKAVRTEALTINGATVAIGEAVQFTITGGTAGQLYAVTIVVGTDSTPAQTISRDVYCQCVA